MKDINCDLAREHAGHLYDRPVAEVCAGITPCGESDHAEHVFMRMELTWCTGICRCGQSRFTPHPIGCHT